MIQFTDMEMYKDEYKISGVCTRCGKKLEGPQQKSWCSANCSKVGLKREYRKRNPEIIKKHRATYRKGHRPLCYKKAQEIRKGKKCYRCGTSKKLHVHHIKPRVNGGDNTLSNLMILCHLCHMSWEKRMKGYWC